MTQRRRASRDPSATLGGVRARTVSVALICLVTAATWPALAALQAGGYVSVPDPAAQMLHLTRHQTAPVHPSFQPLARAIQQVSGGSRGTVAVSLIELGGPAPASWSGGRNRSFTAASTYKLPLLMEESQLISSGRASAADTICFQEQDWEEGWFDDYGDGACFSRGELESRVGTYSDNTAAHMLVRADGGPAALNAYAARLGAYGSSFLGPNQTTAADLARLWAAESRGQAGGQAAQRVLYPLLTDTQYEDGIPAGTPAGTHVVHKIGELDSVVNDAALVHGGPHGDYVLVVCTDGVGGAGGLAEGPLNEAWQLVAAISHAVWVYERGR